MSAWLRPLRYTRRGNFKLLAPAALALFATAGCVSPDHRYAATGAALGGLAGAVIGHQLHGDNGRYVGGAAGAAIGAAVGHNSDRIREARAGLYRPPVRDYPPQRYGHYDDRYEDDRYGYRADDRYDGRGYGHDGGDDYDDGYGVYGRAPYPHY